MRTVLVCVRTPLAAQTVASAAARLGVAGVVRTAVSEPEVMLRLAERPADVVLVDTALTRPDSVGFTRRVLARAPGAAIVLLRCGGARGWRRRRSPPVPAACIRGGDHDLVSVVAKAMLLLCVAGRAPGTAGQRGATAGSRRSGGGRTAPRDQRLRPPARRRSARPAGPVRRAAPVGPAAGRRDDVADRRPTVVRCSAATTCPAPGDRRPARRRTARGTDHGPTRHRTAGSAATASDPANASGYGRRAAGAAGPCAPR